MISTKFDYSGHGYVIERSEDQTRDQSFWRSISVVTRVLMILSQSSSIRAVCILIFGYFSFNIFFFLYYVIEFEPFFPLSPYLFQAYSLTEGFKMKRHHVTVAQYACFKYLHVGKWENKSNFQNENIESCLIEWLSFRILWNCHWTQWGKLNKMFSESDPLPLVHQK